MHGKLLLRISAVVAYFIVDNRAVSLDKALKHWKKL